MSTLQLLKASCSGRIGGHPRAAAPGAGLGGAVDRAAALRANGNECVAIGAGAGVVRDAPAAAAVGGKRSLGLKRANGRVAAVPARSIPVLGNLSRRQAHPPDRTCGSVAATLYGWGRHSITAFDAGRLIQVAVGLAKGTGALFTNRAGCSANARSSATCRAA